MKKLIIILLVLTPDFIHAQSFWNLVHDDQNHNKSHVTDYALFQDSIIIVAGIVSDASCHYNQLFAYDLQGNQIWKRDGLVWLISSDYVVTVDSNYIYAAGFCYGDDFGGEEKVIVSKYDVEGILISELIYPIPFTNPYQFLLKNIDIDFDGNIVVSSEDAVFKTKYQFTNIVRKEIILNSKIKQINVLTSDSYLITTENKLYKTDIEFVLMDSISFNDSVVKTIINSDSVYVLFQDELLQLNTSLTIIDSVIKSSDFDFQNMEIYQNELWLEGNSGEQIHLLKVINNYISDTLVFDRLIDNKGFVISDSGYILIGNSLSKQIALYSIEKNNLGNPNYNLSDIGIVDFTTDNIQIVSIEYMGDSIPIGYRFDTELTLRNNGADTISSFAVYSELFGGFNCARNYYYQKFDDEMILPGQSVTVNLRRLQQDGIDNARLCFQCLAPNSEIESAINDNSMCKTVTIVSTPEIKQPPIRIYPNPISGFINIKTDFEGEQKVILTNLSGKIIGIETIYDTNSRVNLDGLASGFYIIKVVSGNNIYRQILVKK